MSTVFSVFPTPVMLVEQLAGPDLIAQLLKKTQAADLAANAKSNLLSHTEIMQPDATPALQKFARLAAPKLEELGIALFGETLRWSIKEMWMNVLQKGGRQAMHAHANSFVSGVLYLTDSHPSANLVFHKPMGGTDFIFGNAHKTTRTGPFNGARWTLPHTQAGSLVLFPSYMLHEIPENHGPPRISLAFNAIPDHLTSWGYTVRFSR